MHGLGRLFDVGIGWTPVDLDTGNGATGKRISLANADGITFLALLGTAASGTDDLTLNVRQHTAYTSGTSADLDTAAVTTSTGITRWYKKTEAALDNDESWVETTQSDASSVALAGATYAALEKLIVIEVGADQLGDGYTHVSLEAAITTSAVQLSACLYLLHGLRAQRKPANLGNLLNPGAANA